MRSRRASILAIAATCCCIVASISCDFLPSEGAWRKIQRSGFSFEIPGEPQFKDDTMAAGPYNLPVEDINWWRGHEQFSIKAIDFTPMPNALKVDPKALLDSFIQGGLRTTGGTATSDRSIVVSGAPAREMVADITIPYPAWMLTRMIWASPRAYLVSYNCPNSIAESPDGRKFIDSFQLTTK